MIDAQQVNQHALPHSSSLGAVTGRERFSGLLPSAVS
jgi:hypothetical protein